MDSLTQIALGAAFGEAVVGHKVGKKGAIWGAVLGTLPDLDIVTRLFLDPVNTLAAHRSMSHSLLIAIIVAPIIGWGLKRLYQKEKVTRKEWTFMVLLVLVTHILIDLLTIYGTQILWPISTHPFSIDSIFIIDPLYTIPLGAGVILALFRKPGTRARFRVNAAGLIISTIYLTWGMSVKLFVHGDFKQGLAGIGIRTEEVMTAPGPLNSLLWMGLAQKQDTLYAGLHSILDARPPRFFHSIPQNSYLLAGHRTDRAVERLMWFSKGWYAIDQDSLGLTFADYRFGRSDGWMDEEGVPIFHWRLIPDSTGEYVSFEQLPSSFDNVGEGLRRQFQRALGQ